MMTWPRIVVHADMDAFYAAVEQLDNPELRGKPVLVGPNSRRGVVLTASYEARPFRVGSAMPMAQARQRCPQAIIVPPRFERYKEVSAQVMDIFADFSPSVEPISLDEAFLEMTGASHLFGEPEQIGRRLKAQVLDATGLHISVGISATKYVAKVASGHDKPNGLTVVAPDQARAWLSTMPVNRLWGVGSKTADKLNRLGYFRIGDIADADERRLLKQLGASGRHFHELANARDPRRVERGRSTRSIGSERTLTDDITHPDDIRHHLRQSAERIARRLRKKNYVAGGIRVRLKTNRFELLTRQAKLQLPADTADTLFQAGSRLLDTFPAGLSYRLVGMAAYDLDWRAQAVQADLFEARPARELETTIDSLINRFGPGVLRRARDLEPGKTVATGEVNLDFLDYQDGERVSRPRRSDEQ